VIREAKPMTDTASTANDSPDAAPTGRHPNSHGPSPLSARTRRRLLALLLQRAEAGDNSAAAMLIRLSLQVEVGSSSPGAKGDA